MIFFWRIFVRKRLHSAKIAKKCDPSGSNDAFSEMKTSENRRGEPLVKRRKLDQTLISPTGPPNRERPKVRKSTYTEAQHCENF